MYIYIYICMCVHVGYEPAVTHVLRVRVMYMSRVQCNDIVCVYIYIYIYTQ